MSASAVNQVIKAKRIAWLLPLLATATVRSTHNTWHLENLKSDIRQDKNKITLQKKSKQSLNRKLIQYNST
jgi:septal ring factor EnvC (AmiA/AmiB activator)